MELLVICPHCFDRYGGNFDEFDYARYLMRHGISGTGYVVSGKWALGYVDRLLLILLPPLILLPRLLLLLLLGLPILYIPSGILRCFIGKR